MNEDSAKLLRRQHRPSWPPRQTRREGGHAPRAFQQTEVGEGGGSSALSCNKRTMTRIRWSTVLRPLPPPGQPCQRSVDNPTKWRLIQNGRRGHA